MGLRDVFKHRTKPPPIYCATPDDTVGQIYKRDPEVFTRREMELILGHMHNSECHNPLAYYLPRFLDVWLKHWRGSPIYPLPHVYIDEDDFFMKILTYRYDYTQDERRALDDFFMQQMRNYLSEDNLEERRKLYYCKYLWRRDVEGNPLWSKYTNAAIDERVRKEIGPKEVPGEVMTFLTLFRERANWWSQIAGYNENAYAVAIHNVAKIHHESVRRGLSTIAALCHHYPKKVWWEGDPDSYDERHRTPGFLRPFDGRLYLSGNWFWWACDQNGQMAIDRDIAELVATMKT